MVLYEGNTPPPREAHGFLREQKEKRGRHVKVEERERAVKKENEEGKKELERARNGEFNAND